MANYFRKINTKQSLTDADSEDIIYNLDKFHTIYRNKNQIFAIGDDNKQIVIAVCRTSAGARYIMECIEKEAEINFKHLNIREREQ